MKMAETADSRGLSIHIVPYPISLQLRAARLRRRQLGLQPGARARPAASRGLPLTPYPTLYPYATVPSPSPRDAARLMKQQPHQHAGGAGTLLTAASATSAPLGARLPSPAIPAPTGAHQTEWRPRRGSRPPGRAPRVQLLQLGQAQRSGVVCQLGVGGARAQRVALGRRGAQRRPQLLRFGRARRGAALRCLLRRQLPVCSQWLLCSTWFSRSVQELARLG